MVVVKIGGGGGNVTDSGAADEIDGNKDDGDESASGSEETEVDVDVERKREFRMDVPGIEDILSVVAEDCMRSGPK